LQPGMSGVRFDTHIFRQADFIEMAIHNLTQSLALGFLLVMAIIALFLFEWRVALISIITIPLSLMATMLVLYWRGETVNTMTLAGLVIALGAVVDDAIIDVENIVRRLRQNRLEHPDGGGRTTAAVILDASLEVRSPIVYATLIIVAAAVPVFLLKGLTGAFFGPLALSYTLAIVASMAVALTVTPALTLILLRRAPIERRHSPVVGWLQAHYSRLLARIVSRPRNAFVAVIAVTALGAVVAPQLGQSLFPAFKEPDLLMHWVSAPGTSVTDMERTTLAISKEVRAIPGVRSFGAHIGQARLGEEIAGVNLGENWVSIDPSVDYESTVAKVQEVAQTYPGFFRDVQTYLDERIEEVLTGAKAPIVVRVYGADASTLRSLADKIQRQIKQVNGITEAHVDPIRFVPQVETTVNLAKAQKYGLTPGDVRRNAAALIASEEVGNVFTKGKAYNVVVWSTPAARRSLTDIKNLPIDTPRGGTVRLGDVADVRVSANPNAIDREGDSRYLDVGALVGKADLAAVDRAVNASLSSLEVPSGYAYRVLGEYTERQAAQSRLLTTALLAGLAIILLLQMSFGSWRLAALVFGTLPFALVGGVLAAYVGGGIISLGSLIGFFTVFGIAARNGILMINHFQRLETDEGQPFGVGLVLQGAKERLSPILMTSLATGLALVPLVALGDRPGHEIEYPLAVVILGGLLTSTLLNLFIVPSLYLRFGRPRPSTSSGQPREAEV
jgi:CzcA family heavy metal efflux pump